MAILHARFDEQIREFGVAVCSIAAFWTILMTYLGVNFVLASGLHSYGFGSSSLLQSMAIVAAVEIAFLAWGWRARKGRKSAGGRAHAPGREGLSRRGFVRKRKGRLPVRRAARAVQGYVGRRYSERIRTSTRRFSARPFAVALSATGLVSPKPAVEIRAGSIPRFTSRSLTASARFSERVWL